MLHRRRLAEQALPYDVWLGDIVKREKEEITDWKEAREKAGKEALSVDVISEEAFCGRVFAEDGLNGAGEIWLVASEPLRLAEGAAWEAERFFLEHPACGVAYGDEDNYFKPEWSPDLLQSFFYFGNVFAVRRTVVEAAAAKVRERKDLYGKKVPEGALIDGGGQGDEKQDDRPPVREAVDLETIFHRRKLYDIVLCCIDIAKGAEHIDKILFLTGDTEEHSNGAPGENKDWGLCEAFDEIKKGHLYSDKETPTNWKDQKLVSVIIPSKDNPSVLSKCLHSLQEETDYDNIEIIVVDNGSSGKNKIKLIRMNNRMKDECFRYLYQPMPFNFSRMCNIGAKEARGDYLLFLNDDMEIVEENWLRRMLSKAEKEYVGAVGAKLLYPNSKKIQHMGVTSTHLGPAHELQFSWDNDDHYHSYNRSAVNVSGVTGACLLIRREVFEQTGGFSEDLQVAFNDVELCFKLLRLGYLNVCCNDTFLYHHESLSRGVDIGFEKIERLHRERDTLYGAYPEMWNNDRYYSRKLVTDILDRGFKPACRYEEKRLSKKVQAFRVENELKEEWENETLCLGIEFAGDRCAWETGKPGGGDYYIQGCSYAVNIDNSRYEKSLLLRPLDGEDKRWWKVPFEGCYRPDMEDILPFIKNPELCGVSIWLDKDALPPGRYMIGHFWEDTCSRQKLYRFAPEILTVYDRAEGSCGV